MAVGENIRKIRKEQGLTQKQLGELCKMNEVQIRQYELGKANPKIETIMKIADALNVEITDLMEFSAYISELKKESNKQTSFFNFLDSIGYQIHDISFDGKWGIHIKASDTDIYITNEEMDTLIHTTQENINLRITKYISDGKHNQ